MQSSNNISKVKRLPQHLRFACFWLTFLFVLGLFLLSCRWLWEDSPIQRWVLNSPVLITTIKLLLHVKTCSFIRDIFHQVLTSNYFHFQDSRGGAETFLVIERSFFILHLFCAFLIFKRVLTWNFPGGSVLWPVVLFCFAEKHAPFVPVASHRLWHLPPLISPVFKPEKS